MKTNFRVIATLIIGSMSLLSQTQTHDDLRDYEGNEDTGFKVLSDFEGNSI